MKQKLLQFVAKSSIVFLLGATLLNIYAPPPAQAADGPNLITNPSFETETSPGQPGNWLTGFWPEGLEATFDVIEGAGGEDTKAAQTTIANYGGEGDAKWYFTDVPVQAETYYIFRNQYKSDTNSRVFVRYNMGGEAGLEELRHILIAQATPTADWTELSAEFLTPVGVVSATIFHVIEGNGTLAVDDYFLGTKDNPARFETGAITLSFDDGWQSIYDNALPILDAQGYKSTQYIITDVVLDERVGSYMTSAELQQMYNSGHDISAHTRTHASLTLPQLNTAELQDEVSGSRYDLLTRLGVKPADTLAYTYGDYNDTAKLAAKDAGFIGARTIDEGYNELTTDPYALKSISILKGGITDQGAEVPATTIEEVKNAIDNAMSNRAWLIFTLHQVDNDPANIYGATPEFFQEMVNYLAEKQANVKTMNEMMSLMPGIAPKDSEPPLIADMTDILVFAESSEGAVVSFSSPLVTDTSDTSLSAFCLTDNGLVSGSTFPIGSTEMVCNAMDSSGNLATPVAFKINVVDPLAPVVTISTTTSPTRLQELSFTFSSSDDEATLMSSLDGAEFAITTSPQTLSNLSEGAHTFTVHAIDAEDRVGFANTSFIVDLTSPVITLTGSSTINIASGGDFTDPGVVVTDSVDGIITEVVVSGDSITSNTAAGTYSIHYDAKDSAGNEAERVTRTVVVANGPSQSSSGGGGGGYIPSTALVWPPNNNNNNFTGFIAGVGGTENGNGNGNNMSEYESEARMIMNFDGILQLSAGNAALLNSLTANQNSLTADQIRALSFFIQEGTWSSRKLGSGERAGVINSYLRAFDRLPLDLEDWEDIIKISNGRWTKKLNKKAEENAISIFTVIYKRLPNFSNARDDAAVKFMAYGLRPGNRNMNSERNSLSTFFSIFNRLPRQAADWDIVRAIAYSGATR